MDEILNKFGGMENILTAIKGSAQKFGLATTKMLLELFYVLKNPSTSTGNKTIIVAALGYQLLPKDLLPRNKFGLLGLLDNVVTLAFAYNRVKKSITPEIERQVGETLEKWFGNRLDDSVAYEEIY